MPDQQPLPSIKCEFRGTMVVADLNEALEALSREYAGVCDFAVTEQTGLGTLATLAISIAGGVGSNLVIRLIDLLIAKLSARRNTLILTLFHVDESIIFKLPKDREKCIDHFRNLEKNTDD